ncbi:HAD family hydrolase [Candidatus Cytomitobacter primus]|uniref:phosphoglycolate phosphatase n=1 Tax=Candidatus Cytomitobacter primus TaxID=2066024 RepID=A0A5C0UF73_9PROT|nr:HAD-IA family hydrolase [Candidatus Cytomitobacter primus]QEK38756.1 HAD family hydrolase [Candidatus Cytomitobacter primus]
MKPTLVLWDWLGTIENPENAHTFIMNRLLKKHTGKIFEITQQKELSQYWNQISIAMRNVIKAQFPLELERSSTWVSPYAVSLMKYFKQNNIPQCIISNGSGQEIRDQVNELRWDYFDMIIGSEDGFKPKPNPGSVLNLCKKYKLKNDHNIWFIGDSEQDMEFAMHAQIKGIKVKDGLTIVWDMLNEHVK